MTALLVIALSLAWCGPALAEPISATIGLTAALTAAGLAEATAVAVGGVIVSTVASTAIGLGLGLLNKALAGKPKAGEALSGVETNVQFGGDVARQIAIGTCGAKGHFVYHNSPPDLNHNYYQQVFVLSDWYCTDLFSPMFVNGVPYDIAASPLGGGAISYHAPADTFGLIGITFYDGTQTAANGTLVGMAQPPGKWTANSKLTGMAYVMLHFTYLKGSPLYDGGIPHITFGLRGARLYDWRLDDTVGGAGGQRWDNPSTWTFSENPAVAVFNYLRGFYAPNGELIIGMGVPPSDIVLDSFTAAANICDETVLLDAGGVEARYRICTFLSADQTVTHAQTLEVLLATMAGYLYDYGGSYYLQAGAAYATVDTITDDDLVTGAPVSFTAKRSRAELINRIHGQFIRPSDEFQPASYNPQISDSATAADYEELGLPLDLASVASQFQAERIAQIRLREVRRQATASLTLGFEHLNKQVGDWLDWNSGRYGLRTFRIVNKSVEPTSQTVTLELAETHANVFSWTTDDEGDHVPVSVPIQGTLQASTVSSFAIHATTITDADGNEFPALKFTWTPIEDQTIDAVVIEYRRIGETVATRATDSSPVDGVFETTDNVVGGLDYEARATITTTPERITTWTPWVSIRTTNLIITLTPDSPPTIPTGLVITSEIVILADGTVTTLAHFVWNTVTSPNLASYELEVQEDPGTNPAAIDPTKFLTLAFSVTPKFDYRGLAPGTHIWARVKSVSKLDNASGYSSIVGHTLAANTTPPADPAGLTATASFQTIFLSWAANTANKDYDHVTVYEATTNNRASAVAIANVAGTSFTRTGLTPGSTRFYWIRAFNTSGTASTNFFPVSATAGVSATTVAIVSADIAAQAIDQTKFANNMQPVGVIANTAAPHTTGIDTALNTADGKLYKWNGSAWVGTILAPNVVTASEIAADTITAGQIAAGAINASELAAKAVTADKLAVGTKNVAFNTDYQIGSAGFSGWSVETGSGTFSGPIATSGPAGFNVGTYTGTGSFSSRPMLSDGTLLFGYMVTAGNFYESSVCVAISTGSATLRIDWLNASGVFISSSTGNAVSSNTSGGAWVDFPKSGVIAQAPAGAAFARPIIALSVSATLNFSGLVFQGAYSGQTALSPYTTPGVTIIQGGNIRTSTIVTEHLVVNSINGDRIQSNTLDAAKVTAGTVISGTVLVGASGNTLGQTTTFASDPASRVNAFTTQIDPGKILISGSTSLANWRNGTDNTKIEGGSISANSITANTLKIGSRGITVQGVDMQVAPGAGVTGTITWATGFISYTGDAGANNTVGIAAGSASASQGGVVVWQKAATVLTYFTSWVNAVAAFGADMVLMSTYNGVAGLNVTYGGVIIDGGRIRANTITANNLSTGQLITASAQIGDALIINAKIGTAEIDTLKLGSGAVSAQVANSGIIAGGSFIAAGLNLTGGDSDVFILAGATLDNTGPLAVTAPAPTAQTIRIWQMQTNSSASLTGAVALGPAQYIWDNIVSVQTGPTYTRSVAAVTFGYTKPGLAAQTLYAILPNALTATPMNMWIMMQEFKR